MKKTIFWERSFHLISMIALIIVTAGIQGCKKGFTNDIAAAAGAPSDSVHIENKDNWMAIVGDSGSTGAVASPRLKPTLEKIGNYVLNADKSDPKIEDIPSPQNYGIDKLDPMSRILDEPQEAANKIDMIEYSWGYLTGRKLGMKANDIVMVSQDGTRVDSIAKQFARLKETNEPTLPPLILVSYNANDLCDEEVLRADVNERAARFQEEIRKQFEQVMSWAKAHPKGTRIVILAPIDIGNLLGNPQLLSQKIEFQGAGEITCMQLREGQVPQANFANDLRQKMLGMCKSVLDTKPSDRARVQQLIAVQSAFADVWKKMADELNKKYSGQGFHFEYLPNIRTIQFQAGDLANECFHPGIKAHEKIADEVLKFLGR